MSRVAEDKSHRMDGLKWLLVLFVLGGGIYANYHYAAEPLLFRVLGLVLAAAIAAVVALQTAKGAAFWALMKGAQTEIRRVVWPTRQERNQTTMVVVAFILLMAVILWGLDSLLGWLTSMIIG